MGDEKSAGRRRRDVGEGIEEVSVYMLRMFGIPVDHQQPRAADKASTKALRFPPANRFPTLSKNNTL